MKTKLRALTSLALVSAFALAACGGEMDTQVEDQGTPDPSASEEAGADTAGSDGDTESETEGEAGAVDPADREAREVGGPETRLAVTYDGGVAVIDGATLETIDQFEAEGFVRVNPAGDGRHVFLSEGSSFRLLDLGTWGEPHGDHNHYYVTEPYFSEVTVDGDAPGHVVSHDGIGTLFFDGTGEIHSFDLAELSVESDLETEVAETEDAHHGVAVVLEDGSRFETLADRSGARFLDADGEEIARSEECPGVHGEATGPDHIIAVGCEDGALIWDGEAFTKIDAGEDFARSGNLFAHPDSPIFLADYRTDESGEEPMTSVALINTETQSITTTDIDAPYNFRSLARGPEGEALVLAEDGQLHVIDPETGEHIEHVQVLDEWTEPEEWQEPRPAIRLVDDIAYITDPENQQIHMVDLTSFEVINSGDLDFIPNEIAAADGRPAEGVPEEQGHDHGEHGHEEHDHDHADSEDDHDHDRAEAEHGHDHDEDHDH
ncbi:hypothetical protein [Nesterenkonia flava]|uniref:Secreted protein n=1 Tax=Nesterenkonia flava TaxID=469799 RepID=A0ABU1FTB9_9MICC|nr:hypothetical protein [Nesterenkonia flava]MDR5711909.1 hypothetical protein [Nesterenkonia flava]